MGLLAIPLARTSARQTILGELDRGDFGLLLNRFEDNTLLLDRILDRIKAGQENLDIIRWALNWGIDTKALIEILEALDINSRRLAHRFGP